MDRARVSSATTPTSRPSDMHAPAVLLVCTSLSAQTALATPTTCSTQCPSSDVTVLESALAPAATSVSSNITIGIVPECFEPEPAVVTSTPISMMDISGARAPAAVEPDPIHGAPAAVLRFDGATPTALVPWPPPRLPLSHVHGLFHHTQQHRDKFLLAVWVLQSPLPPTIQYVEGSQRIWNEEWPELGVDSHPFEKLKMIELKPPWLIPPGLCTNMPAAWTSFMRQLRLGSYLGSYLTDQFIQRVFEVIQWKIPWLFSCPILPWPSFECSQVDDALVERVSVTLLQSVAQLVLSRINYGGAVHIQFHVPLFEVPLYCSVCDSSYTVHMQLHGSRNFQWTIAWFLSSQFYLSGLQTFSACAILLVQQKCPAIYEEPWFRVIMMAPMELCSSCDVPGFCYKWLMLWSTNANKVLILQILCNLSEMITYFSCPPVGDWLLHCLTQRVFLSGSGKIQQKIAGLLDLALIEWKPWAFGVYFWANDLNAAASVPDIICSWFQFKIQDTTVELESHLATTRPITCSTVCSEGDTSAAASQEFTQATCIIINGELVSGNKMLRLPWNTSDPCSDQRCPCNPMELEMHTLFIPVCGSATLLDECSCSILLDHQLEPWPSWEKTLLVFTVERAKFGNCHSIVVPVRILGKGNISLQYLGKLYEKQYSNCKGQQSGHVTRSGSKWVTWKIAWFLVGTCHACSDLGGSVHVINKRQLLGHGEKLIGVLSLQSTFCCTALHSTIDTLQSPLAETLFPCTSAAKPPDSTSPCGILRDLHCRLGLMLLGVQVVWIHLTLVNITQLQYKGVNYWKYPMPSVYQVMLQWYKLFSTWSTFPLELLHNTPLQDWIHSDLIGHNIQCHFGILPWPVVQLHLSVLAQMKCFCELPFCTSWVDRLVLKDDGLEIGPMQPVSSDLMYCGEILDHCHMQLMLLRTPTATEDSDRVSSLHLVVSSVSTIHNRSSQAMVETGTFSCQVLEIGNRKFMTNILDNVDLLSRVHDAQLLLNLARCSTPGDTFSECFLYVVSMVLLSEKLQLSWDPGGFGCFIQAEAKRRNAAASAYDRGHYQDHAYFFNKVCAEQDYYLDVFRDQVHIGHNSYIGVFLEQVCGICYLNLVKVCLDYSKNRDLSEFLKHQVPWDPGGSTWHRLEVKPKIKEGGMLAILLPGDGPPLLGQALLEARRGGGEYIPTCQQRKDSARNRTASASTAFIFLLLSCSSSPSL